MNQLRLFIPLSLVLLTISCKQLEEENKRINKPESMGEFGDISLIIPSSLDSSFTDSIRSILEQPVSGLPFGGEPHYKVRITDETYLKGYFVLHANVVMFVPRNRIERFKSEMDPKQYGQLVKLANSGKPSVIIRNFWSVPQIVQIYFANDEADLVNSLSDIKQNLLDASLISELETGRKRLFRSGVEADSFALNLLKEQSYAIRKKKGMRIALQNNEFCWLREESRKYNLGIFMYSEDYTGPSQFSRETIIQRRNRYTSKYIHGTLPGTYMKVAFPEEVELTEKEINFNGRFAKEIRGWWELENDFMGGPFVNYTIYDEELAKVITIEGYVYAPNESKAALIRELEVILHTFSTSL